MDDISDRDGKELDENDEGPKVLVDFYYPTWVSMWEKYYKTRNPRLFR